MEYNYGLYQTLNVNIPRRKLTKQQKDELWDKLKNIEEEETNEVVFMLIYEHNRVSDKGKDESLPYKGKKRTKGVEFNLENFPRRLQWILFKFFSFIQE